MQLQNRKPETIQDVYERLCMNKAYMAFCEADNDMIKKASAALKIGMYGWKKGDPIHLISQHEDGPVDIVTPSYENIQHIQTGKHVAREMYGINPEDVSILSEESFEMKREDRLENRLKCMATLKNKPRERFYFNKTLYTY